jgi:hypothetical protein
MGKPPPTYLGGLPTEFIGWEEDTQRTETSYVAGEKKSNEIPLVVASEEGIA